MKTISGFLVATISTMIVGTAESQGLFYMDVQRDGMTSADLVQSLTVSPDGKHVYVAKSDIQKANLVVAYRRNPKNGKLTEIPNAVSSTGSLHGAKAMALSPDGQFLYLARLSQPQANDGAVLVLKRDDISGRLTLIPNGEHRVAGMGSPYSIAVSPDGAHVYAVSLFDDSLVEFSRDTSSGQLLSPIVHRNGVNLVEGLISPTSVAVSPDSSNVYVGANVRLPLGAAVAVFRRKSAADPLRFEAVYQQSLEKSMRALGTDSVTVSPDGAHVYAAFQHGLAVFGRNVTDGTLTIAQVAVDPFGGLFSFHSVAVGPDGRNVYGVDMFNHSVTMFNRNTSTGELRTGGIHRNDSSGVDGVYLPVSVAVSPDSAHIYVLRSWLDPGVAVFSRTLLWPVPSTKKYDITQDYAEYRVTTDLQGNVKERTHVGVDIRARSPLEVRAAAGGTARIVDLAAHKNKTRCLGNIVVIDHGPVSTLYGHLSDIYVKEGEFISADIPIGMSGNSSGLYMNGTKCNKCEPGTKNCTCTKKDNAGNCIEYTRPFPYHLHFEVRVGPVLDANDLPKGPPWGYVDKKADPISFGYRDPVLFFHAPIDAAMKTVKVTPQGAGASMRVGPSALNLKSTIPRYPVTGELLQAGRDYVQIRAHDGSKTNCSKGWSQVRNSNSSWFTTSTGREVPDVWVCRGNGTETWITP